MIDTAIDHVASELGVEPEEIRKKNLYSFNDTTPYGMPVHVKLKVDDAHHTLKEGGNKRLIFFFFAKTRKYGRNVRS